MSWAFEAYATGEWTLRKLLVEVTDRGLTSVGGPKTPPRNPYGLSQLPTACSDPPTTSALSVTVAYSIRGRPTRNPWYRKRSGTEFQTLLAANNFRG